MSSRHAALALPPAGSAARSRLCDIAFVGLFTTFAVVEALVLPIARGGDDRLLAVVLSAAMALVFIPRRRWPVLVYAAMTALYLLRIELKAAPSDTYVFQIAVLAGAFGVAAYGSRARLWWRVAIAVLVTIAGRAILVAEVRPLEFMGEVDRALWVYLFALFITGVVLGYEVRDRTQDVRRLQRRVEELDAALPRRESDAAAEEQRRVSAEVRRLVTALAARVELLLAGAQRSLGSNAEEAREAIARTGDAARATLATMRELLDRLRSDDEEDEPSGVRPEAATVDDLAGTLERAGTDVVVERDPRFVVPGVLVLAADRVAGVAVDVLGGPPERALLRVSAGGLVLELAGPRRRRGAPAPSPARLAVAERVRLLGGALRLRPRRGKLTLWLPLEAAPEGRASRRHERAWPHASERRGEDGAVSSGFSPRPLGRHGIAVALLIALGLVDLISQPAAPPAWERLVVTLAVPLPLLARRSHPILALLGFEALLIAGSAHGTLGDNASLAWLAAMVAAFFVGSSSLRLPAAIATGLAAVGLPLVAMSLETTYWSTQSYISYAGMLAAAWIVGRVVRDRLAAAAAARVQLDRLDARRRRMEERAAAAERARLARELHDVVGHAILVVCIQTGAAERLAGDDDAAAAEAISSARSASATALRELDRLSRLMPAAAADEGPGLSDLPALAERLRESGVGVELQLMLAEPVPKRLSATVYRIVQEALTNVAKHAAGALATVALEVRDDRLVMSVSNPAGEPIGAASGGHGLRNMRERAAEHGGILRAAADQSGGWTVHASFPLDRATADAVG